MTHLPLPAAALSSALLALTLLAGCAAAPAADPHTGDQAVLMAVCLVFEAST